MRLSSSLGCHPFGWCTHAGCCGGCTSDSLPLLLSLVLRLPLLLLLLLLLLASRLVAGTSATRRASCACWA
jgi:hypothetical protein